MLLFVIIWTVFAFIIHKTCRVDRRPEVRRFDVIDTLVHGYMSVFASEHFTRAKFEENVKFASKESRSRGATAVVQIISKQVYVDLAAFTSPYSWDRLRLQFLLGLVQKIAGQHDLGDFEMIVNVHDCLMREAEQRPHAHQVPIFTMTKCKGALTVPLPQWYRMRDGKWSDFKFAFPAGQEVAQKMAVFRGSFRRSVLRFENDRLQFVNVTSENFSKVGRTALLHLADLRPDLLSVSLFADNPQDYHLLSMSSRRNSATQQSMLEQARQFKYAVHVEGACGWADRLKNWLLLNMITLKQDAACDEFFAPLLRENVHFVKVNDSMTDLVEKIEWLNGNDELVAFLKRNIEYFAFRFLNTDAWEYYVERVLTVYSSTFKFGTVKRRPGARKFIREAKCNADLLKSKSICDDSEAFM